MNTRTTCKFLVLVAAMHACSAYTAGTYEPGSPKAILAAYLAIIEQENTTPVCSNQTLKSDVLPKCPTGETCILMHNSVNSTKCMPSSGDCRTNKQCGKFRCVTGERKCGFCVREGKWCNFDHKSLPFKHHANQCCEGYCDFHNEDLSLEGVGVCKNFVNKKCLYPENCPNGLHCHDGWCQRCKRVGYRCHSNVDCCTFNCDKLAFRCSETNRFEDTPHYANLAQKTFRPSAATTTTAKPSTTANPCTPSADD